MIKSLTVIPTLQTNRLADVTFSCADDVRKRMVVDRVMLIHIRLPAEAYLENKVLSQGTFDEEADVDFEIIPSGPPQGPVADGSPEALESLGQISRGAVSAFLVVHGFQVFQDFILWMDR